MWTFPEGWGAFCLHSRFRSVWCRFEALKAERQKGASMPVGKEAKVPDANETLWQMVKQKAAQELVCRYFHDLFNVSMSPVSPAERDLSIRKGDQAVVGDGHSMGIAAQITEHVFRAAERPFAVHNPVLARYFADKGIESLRVREMFQFAVETDLSFSESGFEGCPDFSPEDFSEHILRQKKPWIAADPVLTIEG
jgi:hypothetical protein